MPWPTSERTIERPCGLDVLLDGVGDVAEAVADAALLDGGEQRALGHVQQLQRDRRDVADREGAGGVGDPAVLHDADVDGQDVAARELELAGMPWTTMSFGEAQIEPGKPR